MSRKFYWEIKKKKQRSWISKNLIDVYCIWVRVLILNFKCLELLYLLSGRQIYKYFCYILYFISHVVLVICIKEKEKNGLICKVSLIISLLKYD